MTHRLYKISDCCSLVRGICPTLKTEPGEYPLVVTAAYRRSASTYQLEGPAVCVPLISSTGHGDAALHRVHYQEGKFALANLLVALLPKDLNVCDAKYLYYLLTAKKDEYFVPLMLGTANVSLKEKDIANVKIPLPSVEEQRRIVARIEKLETKLRDAYAVRQEIEGDLSTLLKAAYQRIVKGVPRKPLGEIAPLNRRPVVVESDEIYPQVAVRSFGRGTFHKPPLNGREVTWQKPFLVDCRSEFVST